MIMANYLILKLQGAIVISLSLDQAAFIKTRQGQARDNSHANINMLITKFVFQDAQSPFKQQSAFGWLI